MSRATMFRTLVTATPVTVTSARTPHNVMGTAEAAPRWDVKEYACKRVFDFLFASVALLISLPVGLVIALAVKLEDGGPVFFTQTRWGRGKRPFRVCKFRSMVVDAEHRVGQVQAAKDDSRFTRVGRMLRATSLDELPQLFNIWKGDMSWVGPRALPMNERQLNETEQVADDRIRGFDLRCTARPGLTGIAQIFAPRDVARARKFRYDGFYIRRQSFWVDVKLIVLSCVISAMGSWEDRERRVFGRRSRRRLRKG